MNERKKKEAKSILQKNEMLSSDRLTSNYDKNNLNERFIIMQERWKIIDAICLPLMIRTL